MHYVRKRMRSRRFLLSAAMVVVVVGGGAAIAYAAVGYPTDSVTLMTGCLTNSGTSAGNLGSIAVGSNPAKPCGSNQMMIHLSGGTITRVTAGTGVTVSGPGTGGTGYVDNGFATIGLNSAYTLPQSCSDKQVSKWDQTSGSWKCADDNSYTAGDGLALSNSNAFSLKSGYELPQSCSNGQVPVSSGNDSWSCQSISGSMYQYVESWSVDLGDNDTQSAYAYCNNGDIRTGGGINTDSDAKQSAPWGTSGWVATASTGFEFGFGSGFVRVFVDCLHVS